MTRPVWTGSLSFGRVNVSIGLVPATVNTIPTFHQFQRGTTDRIRYRRINERTGEEVAYDDIVKGVEAPDGEVVTFDDEELEAVAPGRSHTLELSGFVAESELPVVFHQKTYYLVPGVHTTKPYALLCTALSRSGKIGLGSFVLYGKQQFAAVRPMRDVLTLDTLFFADEVREPETVLDTIPDAGDFSKRDIDTAVRLIETMTTSWRPEDFPDRYREAVQRLVRSKLAGTEVGAAPRPPEETNVVDLMDALQSSLREHTPQEGQQPTGERSGQGQQQRRGVESARPDSSMTKRELLRLAADLDVPGRSRMSRDDLATAVSEARRRMSKPNRAS
ncbi:non-homologous end joining protein Ku [Salinactinospora qingdaonensis]|uniref:Non-homologous end joining protein Ku n=1 Tax=Salinactinospora qingdaonensis TaxID=702744 RepID=A0ABP7FD18_9ACTN